MVDELTITTKEKELLRKETFLHGRLSKAVLRRIYKNKWLRIWIPKRYDGLDLSLGIGLKLLHNLAKIDGSLSWFVTLTSGANYFSRYIEPKVSEPIFKNPYVCFGGSGQVSGTAKKIGENYLINGKWQYATGAPYLTHFTFNAQVIENGIPLIDAVGNPVYLSFFVPQTQVLIIKSWNTFGLLATETHDFEIKDLLVPKQNSFKYDYAYGSDVLDCIPFNLFADLTLLVNYIGIAEHFLEASKKINHNHYQMKLDDYLIKQSSWFYEKVNEIENHLSQDCKLEMKIADEIHAFGEHLVEELSYNIINIYKQLGVRAAKIDEETNWVFRDFFTATQHNIFRKKINL